MATKPLIGWLIYDWASNAYAAVILTFVFPAYFAQQIVQDPARGTQLWGQTLGIGELLVALFAPFLGAIADQMGRSKLWIGFFTAVSVAATALLWFAEPSPGHTQRALLLVVIGLLGIEFATIFYNAMLPRLAQPERLGRWSGWAWSAGYGGGLGCLLAVLFLLVRENPWLALDRESYEHVRAGFVLASLWYAVFALPLFWMTPDTPLQKPLRSALVDGLRQLKETVRSLRRYGGIIRFLIARIIYIDGLGTLFVFGGIYAAGTFNMKEQEVLVFGIVLNISAGLGALAFAWIDDWIGGKRTILISLAGLIVSGSLLLLVDSEALFWTLGVVLGLFVGPVQAASRSFLARIAPGDLRNQFFGFYAFSGKATSFAGPLLVAWLTGFSGSQRIGMSVIIVYFFIGFVLMLRVPDEQAAVGAGK